jgi:hypothetical protein
MGSTDLAERRFERLVVRAHQAGLDRQDPENVWHHIYSHKVHKWKLFSDSRPVRRLKARSCVQKKRDTHQTCQKLGFLRLPVSYHSW